MILTGGSAGVLRDENFNQPLLSHGTREGGPFLFDASRRIGFKAPEHLSLLPNTAVTVAIATPRRIEFEKSQALSRNDTRSCGAGSTNEIRVDRIDQLF